MPRYKTNRGKDTPANKTDLNLALKYATYYLDRYHLLSEIEGPIKFPATSPYEEKVLEYLHKNADQNYRNKLHGIVAVTDFWHSGKFATGGRICLWLGGEGNLLEVLDSDIVYMDPVDYENKDLVMRKIFSTYSPTLPPDVGNTHLHPSVSNLTKITNLTIREELTRDHGLQNPVHQRADLKFRLFKVVNGHAYWQDNTSTKEIELVFGRS